MKNTNPLRHRCAECNLVLKSIYPEPEEPMAELESTSYCKCNFCAGCGQVETKCSCEFCQDCKLNKTHKQCVCTYCNHCNKNQAVGDDACSCQFCTYCNMNRTSTACRCPICDDCGVNKYIKRCTCVYCSHCRTKDNTAIAVSRCKCSMCKWCGRCNAPDHMEQYSGNMTACFCVICPGCEQERHHCPCHPKCGHCGRSHFLCGCEEKRQTCPACNYYIPDVDVCTHAVCPCCYALRDNTEAFCKTCKKCECCNGCVVVDGQRHTKLCVCVAGKGVCKTEPSQAVLEYRERNSGLCSTCKTPHWRCNCTIYCDSCTTGASDTSSYPALSSSITTRAQSCSHPKCIGCKQTVKAGGSCRCGSFTVMKAFKEAVTTITCPLCYSHTIDINPRTDLSTIECINKAKEVIKKTLTQREAAERLCKGIMSEEARAKFTALYPAMAGVLKLISLTPDALADIIMASVSKHGMVSVIAGIPLYDIDVLAKVGVITTPVGGDSRHMQNVHPVLEYDNGKPDVMCTECYNDIMSGALRFAPNMNMISLYSKRLTALLCNYLLLKDAVPAERCAFELYGYSQFGLRQTYHSWQSSFVTVTRKAPAKKIEDSDRELTNFKEQEATDFPEIRKMEEMLSNQEELKAMGERLVEEINKSTTETANDE